MLCCWFCFGLKCDCTKILFLRHFKGGVHELDLFSRKICSYLFMGRRQTLTLTMKVGKKPQLTHCEYQWKMQMRASLWNMNPCVYFLEHKNARNVWNVMYSYIWLYNIWPEAAKPFWFMKLDPAYRYTCNVLQCSKLQKNKVNLPFLMKVQNTTMVGVFNKIIIVVTMTTKVH